ncbi:DUF3850 domain-containing protein [Peribacillus frigoritolerans]
MTQYTGRRTSVTITYITDFGQVNGYVVMAIKLEGVVPSERI